MGLLDRLMVAFQGKTVPVDNEGSKREHQRGQAARMLHELEGNSASEDELFHFP